MCETQRQMTFDEKCNYLRVKIKDSGEFLLDLKDDDIFRETESYKGQHAEMNANIMLVYRHLEDARMRVGKILQAAGDGVSILDK